MRWATLRRPHGSRPVVQRPARFTTTLNLVAQSPGGRADLIGGSEQLLPFLIGQPNAFSHDTQIVSNRNHAGTDYEGMSDSTMSAVTSWFA